MFLIKLHKTKRSSGQALIAVLLVIAVILTTALSITSRSTLDITQSTYEEDALRAFSAAEAGVEKALLSGESVPETNVDSTGNVKFTAPIVTNTAGSEFKYPVNLNNGDVATIWFVSHDGTTNELKCGDCTRANKMNICWGTDSSINSNTPAVEVSYYYDPTYSAIGSPNNYSSVRVKTITGDPYSGRTSQNGFSTTYVGSCPLSNDYNFGMKDISLNSGSLLGSCALSTGCMLMAKIRMLYNPSSDPQPLLVSVDGGNKTLPAQGFEIQSTGTAGDSTRKLNVLRLWPEPQSVFNGAVFGYNNLVKM